MQEDVDFPWSGIWTPLVPDGGSRLITGREGGYRSPKMGDGRRETVRGSGSTRSTNGLRPGGRGGHSVVFPYFFSFGRSSKTVGRVRSRTPFRVRKGIRFLFEPEPWSVFVGCRRRGRGTKPGMWDSVRFPPNFRKGSFTRASMASTVDAILRQRKNVVEDGENRKREREGFEEASKRPRGSVFGLPRAPKLGSPVRSTSSPLVASPKKQATTSMERKVVDESVTLLKGRLLEGKMEETGAVLGSATLQSLRKKLQDLLKGTIENGHNNSILLLGPRGTGKTLVLERTLEELEQPNLKEGDSPVAIIRLNGLVHSEERVALREIARQLCERHAIPFSRGSSLDDNLAFLHDIMKELRGHRACIFVLDEFDAFATRSKQTLLYNLLDAMQTSFVQAALVGVSARYDCLELLEKRVRSRFSHRKLLFSSPPPADPAGTLIQLLKLPHEPLFPHTQYATRFNRALTQAMTTPAVRRMLERIFDYNSTARQARNVAIQVLCRMGRKEGVITEQDVLEIGEKFLAETHVEVLKGLSILELYILVSMFRLHSKERESPNFEEVFAEYEEGQLTNTTGSTDRFSRVAAFRAFENLLSLELISFLDGTRIVLKRYKPSVLLIGRQDLQAALQVHPKATPFLKRWLSHEHVGNTGGQL